MQGKKHCVYQFIDNSNTPFYVGQTNNYHRRKTEHLCVLKKGKKGKTWPVYNKIRKLIKEEKYELKMEILKNDLNFSEANELEIKYIKEYKESGIKLCNLTAGGEGAPNCVRKKWTLKQRKKLSNSKKGKYIGEENPFFGKHHTDETKEKISKAHKGKQTGDQNPFYGKKHSNEVIKKMSDTAKKTFSGIPKTEEHKRKIANSHIGLRPSKESIEKNRLAQSNLYKITSPKNEEFIWSRGLIQLTLYIMDNYGTSITASSLGIAQKENRKSKGWRVEKIIN